MSNNENKPELHEVGETNGKLDPDKTRPGWVKFDDGETTQGSAAAAVASTSRQSSPRLPAAVLNTETVQVNFDRGDKNVEVPHNTLSKNVEFVTIRQGFSKYQPCAN